VTNLPTGSGGGYKKDRHAQQIVNRCFKFLKFCCEEEKELNFEVMDFGLCSPSLCKLEHGGRLGYVDAISELIEFKKVNGAWDAVLRKLFVIALHLKRACKTVDARSGYRNIRGQGSLGNNGRAARSHDFSLVSLRTDRFSHCCLIKARIQMKPLGFLFVTKV